MIKQINERNQMWINLLVEAERRDASDRLADEVEAAERAAGWPYIADEPIDEEALYADMGFWNAASNVERIAFDGQWSGEDRWWYDYLDANCPF